MKYKCRYAPIDAERLRQIISYDKATGELRWKISRRMVKAGDLIDFTHGGHIRVSIDNHMYLGHRLAWLYVTGEWPKEQVDHINGVRNDNRWANLRECSDSQNKQNLAPKTGRELPMGVRQKGQRFASQIRAMGRNLHLGVFDTPAEAHQAYLNAKAFHHTFNPTPRI